MKYFRFIQYTICIAAFAGMFALGCKYEVADPKWYTDPSTTAIPVINQIIPANIAAPGVTKIYIHGNNFGPDTNSNFIYFGTTIAEVISASDTLIEVYRPNSTAADSSVIVSPKTTYTPAKFSPYKVPVILKNYCVLPNALSPDNLAVTALTVDNSENLFLTRTLSKGVFRVDTAITIDSLAIAPSNITDAVVGIDNRLYLLPGPKIQVMSLPNGTTTTLWKNCAKTVRYGDFDANGYFYAGGTNTNFVIISPSLTLYNSDITYITSNVLAVRVAGGYVYVAAKSTSSGTKIYRHPVTSDGTLGTQQLVYDWSASSFASSNITSLAFGSDGTIYVGTDASSNAIVALTAQGADYFYKGILPGYCVQLAWGNGHYLYMLTGNTAAGAAFVTYKIDMGTTRASR
jgi:hypothetical protein